MREDVLVMNKKNLGIEEIIDNSFNPLGKETKRLNITPLFLKCFHLSIPGEVYSVVNYCHQFISQMQSSSKFTNTSYDVIDGQLNQYFCLFILTLIPWL